MPRLALKALIKFAGPSFVATLSDVSSRGKRIAAGSYLTSGLGGTLALVLGVLAAGLLAAACGGCKR